jgi:outer membrane protein OmpA-like peptidoglycan-associated protein
MSEHRRPLAGTNGPFKGVGMNRSHICISRNRIVNLFILLLVGGIFCMAMAPAAAWASKFNCTYDTNLGKLYFTIDDQKQLIYGEYPKRSGKIVSRAEFGVLEGKWYQTKSGKSGYFYLAFNQSGDEFRGKWAYAGDEKWRGDWTGERSTCEPDKNNKRDYVSEYDHLDGADPIQFEYKSASGVSRDKCAETCSREWECQGFAWSNKTKECYLMDEPLGELGMPPSKAYELYSKIPHRPGMVMDATSRLEGMAEAPAPTGKDLARVARDFKKTKFAGGSYGAKTTSQVKTAAKAVAPQKITASAAPAATSGKWYSLAYSPKYRYWNTTHTAASKASAAAEALEKCNAKTKNTCKTIETREDEHISIVVSKKWNVYKSGEDDRQRAFDYCYGQRGPCRLLVRVGPGGVVEKNKVNFKKLKTSTGKQPAKVSAKYQHYFANSEKDLWNGLLSDLGGEIDKEAGNKIASTMLSMFKNAEKPKSTGRISLDMRFDSDCSAIRKQARTMLNKLGNLLSRKKEIRILIRGHNSGKSNMIPLSLARARSVKAYLVKNYDIDPKRIKTEGIGNTEPLVKEKTRSAALVNQRVDVEML